MNGLWYMFTIIFLLYRFTTFFTYAYNFLRFCGRLVSGVQNGYNWVISFFKRKMDDTTYHHLPNQDPDVDTQQSKSNSSFFDNAARTIKRFFQRTTLHNSSHYDEETASSIGLTRYDNSNSDVHFYNQKDSNKNVSFDDLDEIDNQYHNPASYNPFRSVSLYVPHDVNSMEFSGSGTSSFANAIFETPTASPLHNSPRTDIIYKQNHHSVLSQNLSVVKNLDENKEHDLIAKSDVNVVNENESLDSEDTSCTVTLNSHTDALIDVDVESDYQSVDDWRTSKFIGDPYESRFK